MRSGSGLVQRVLVKMKSCGYYIQCFRVCFCADLSVFSLSFMPFERIQDAVLLKVSCVCLFVFPLALSIALIVKTISYMIYKGDTNVIRVRKGQRALCRHYIEGWKGLLKSSVL